MAFQTVPFPIAGASYQSRSKPLSSQQTVNWYQQFNPEQKEDFVLLPFPGLLHVGDYDTPAINRGLTRMSEILYQVKGAKLFSIDSLGNHTELGAITGTGRCNFANDGINLVIVTSNRTFIYSSDTNNITESTLTGVTGAKSVEYLNAAPEFVFTFDNQSSVATLDNSNKNFTLGGVVGADIKPDNMVKDFIFEQVLWRLGERTIEGWYNAPNVTPPLSRLDGQAFNVGCKSQYSIAQTDEYFYWLGDDNAIYRGRAGIKERISSDAISNELEKNNNTDATAFTFTLQGQNFYCITLPQSGKTFCLNEGLGISGWFELSSGINGVRYQGDSLVNCYGENWVADEVNGKVYKLDLNTFTNDGETIKRTRVTRSINGKIFGQPGKRVMMSRAEFIMETGEGLLSGQGENPRIMIEPSYDGGKTFDTGTWARTGRLGENVLRVEWYNLKSFYDLIIRITTTDPVNFNLFGATIDLRLAGK